MKLDYSTYDTDKNTTHSYMEFYEALFAKYDDVPVSLLEIGVAAGGSMKMWKDFFVEGSSIHGVDNWAHESWLIHTHLGTTYPCGRHHPNHPKNVKGCTIHEGDATTIQLKEKFDIIIDDGSHQFEEVVLALKNLWWNLKAGGIYIVEDVASDSTCGWVHDKWDKEMQNRIGLKYKIIDMQADQSISTETYDNVLLVFEKEN